MSKFCKYGRSLYTLIWRFTSNVMSVERKLPEFMALWSLHLLTVEPLVLPLHLHSAWAENIDPILDCVEGIV